MNICQYCKKEFPRGKSFGAHIRNCKMNPKHDEIIKKIKLTIKNKWKIFKVKCNKCNKEFDIKEFNVNQPKKEKYFCSNSCANSRGPRSNKVKEKISKKLKQKLENGEKIGFCKINFDKYDNIKQRKLKKIYCVSCNEEIFNRSRKYCEGCSFFSGYKKLFEKLGIEESNIKKANNQALKILKKEYFDDKKSLGDLMGKYNIQLNSLHFFFKKNGVDLKSVSRGIKDSILNGKVAKVQNNTIYKSGWHETWNGKKVYLRSSYEFNYAKILDSYKINYDVESKRIEYYDSIREEFRIAIPDFYLIDLNTIAEIKSSYTLDLQNMKDKYKKYKEEGYNFKLILDNKEVELNKI